MAALIRARLSAHLQTIFPASEVTLWSDSQIVLHWLSTKKPLTRFVANRVTEIQDLTKQYTWKYCPTSDNPADLLTRGITAEKFMNNDLWMRGPRWLPNKSQWPTWDNSEQLHVQTLTEEQLTGSKQPVAMEQTTTDMTSPMPSNNVQNIIDVEKYSSFNKLLLVTAYVFRFVQNCKSGKSRGNVDHLSATELKQADLLWIHDCQASHYREDILQMKSNKVTTPLIKQLRLFLDDAETIRCGGRIHNSHVHDVTKFPYLLPKKHRLSTFIVRAAHERQGHSGLNSTVTSIRQKFWILAIRQCVNTVIRKCVVCRKVHGIAYKSTDVPPLPKLIVEEGPPFTITGVDFTGALYIKGPTGAETKAYICLFTCPITKAVHLEVVSSLSTDCFLQAVPRFTSRKSLPRMIVSDNAKTFQTASTYLKTMFESRIVQESLANIGINWKFIPERAPWYGGWWERLIGITKQALKKILGRALVDLETLQTVVAEIESILNDRPITFVSSNVGDPEPLTPSHLLYGRKIRSLPYLGAELESSIPTPVEHNIISRRARNQSGIMSIFGHVGERSISQHSASDTVNLGTTYKLSVLVTWYRSMAIRRGFVGS